MDIFIHTICIQMYLKSNILQTHAFKYFKILSTKKEGMFAHVCHYMDQTTKSSTLGPIWLMLIVFVCLFFLLCTLLTVCLCSCCDSQFLKYLYYWLLRFIIWFTAECMLQCADSGCKRSKTVRPKTQSNTPSIKLRKINLTHTLVYIWAHTHTHTHILTNLFR